MDIMKILFSIVVLAIVGGMIFGLIAAGKAIYKLLNKLLEKP